MVDPVTAAIAAIVRALIESGPIGLLALAGWVLAIRAVQLLIKSWQTRVDDAKASAEAFAANNAIINKVVEEMRVIRQVVTSLSESSRVSNEIRQRELGDGRRNRDTASG